MTAGDAGDHALDGRQAGLREEVRRVARIDVELGEAVEEVLALLQTLDLADDPGVDEVALRLDEARRAVLKAAVVGQVGARGAREREERDAGEGGETAQVRSHG